MIGGVKYVVVNFLHAGAALPADGAQRKKRFRRRRFSISGMRLR